MPAAPPFFIGWTWIDTMSPAFREWLLQPPLANLVAYETEQKMAGRNSEYDLAWAAEAVSKPDAAAPAGRVENVIGK